VTLVDEGLERSIELLRRASTGAGFVASPAFDHYAAVWARDAAISCLGALVSGDDDLIDTSVRSFISMSGAQTPLGQVAAVIGPDGWDWVEAGVVDATAWYVILGGAILEATGDIEVISPHWPRVRAGVEWLRHQDVTASGLISAAPGTDWMDSSLTRSGRTLNLNLLYYWAARSAARISAALGETAPIDPEDIGWRVDLLFWPSPGPGPERLFRGSGAPVPDVFPHGATVAAYRDASERDRRHYVSHVIHAMFDESCDVLANLVAVCLGLPGTERGGLILDHLEDERASHPHPTRTWTRPITADSTSSMRILGVEEHLDPRWANPPHCYHNGGAWPFVGGFHVAALALSGRGDEATDLLERLATANRVAAVGEWGFHEWLHGETGLPDGAPNQTWNAGLYVLAHTAVREPGRVRGLFT